MSFKKLYIENLKFKKLNNILDVGTGGFLGQNTLVHLLNDYTYLNIDLLEINDNLCQQLKKTYKNFNIINYDFFNYTFVKKYDLVICDFPAFIFISKFDEILKKSYDILNNNGYLVVMCLKNFDDINILTSDKNIIENFRTEYNKWNTTNITNDILINKLDNKYKLINYSDHTHFTRYCLFQKI